MYFTFSRAVAVLSLPMLGGALAVAAAALPASAATWQDTALSASSVTDGTFGGTGLKAKDGSAVINLAGFGVTWSLHSAPAGVSQSGTTIRYAGAAATSPPDVVVDATDSAGNAEALEIPVTITKNSIQVGGGPVVTVALSKLADANVYSTVQFSAASTIGGDTITFTESGLPAGLVSGSPVLTYSGGTAAPGIYSGVNVAATDSEGAVLNGSFTLTVKANQVYAAGSYGNEVNRFGNGFDVYQQHDHAGAVIAGWTATQADPATHFLLQFGKHSGAIKLEYAPKGRGSGLCVSDPGGGWASDPLRDGLILTACNNGPWQQFVPQSDGTLKNLATGLYVNPAGTGAQLRGGGSATSWGGSVYAWRSYSSLPR